MSRLALSMLRGAGRRGLARVALIVGGVAGGVALLLGAAAIIPAHDAEAARVYQRTNPALQRRAGSHAPYLLWAPLPLGFGPEYMAGRQLSIIRVAPGTRGAPLPLGADRIPTPGTMLVSPALRALNNVPGLSKLIASGVGSLAEIIRMTPALATGFTDAVDPVSGEFTIGYAPPKLALPPQQTDQICAALRAVAGQQCGTAGNGAVTVPALPVLLSAVSAK